MPRAIWDETLYTNAYKCPLQNDLLVNGVNYSRGQIVGYGRAMYLDSKVGDNPRFNTWNENIRSLGTKLNLSFGSSILLVGCGFGYTMEEAKALGVNKIWGADTSPYIQANKATQSAPEIAPLILNIDVTHPDALTQLRPFVGGSGRVNWVITELVVESLLSAELTTFLNACDSLRTGTGGVAHIVACKMDTPVGGLSPHKDSPLWQRTLEEWAAERPSHYWLDWNNDNRVLGGA